MTVRRPWVIAAALTGVAAVTAGVIVWATSSGDPAPEQPRRVAVAASPQPTTPAPSPSTSTPPAVPHDRVPAGQPTAFTVSGPAFTIKADVCSMAPVLPLDPPGDQHDTVCWVNDRFGVAPGSDSGTSFILGHAWAPDPDEVLNKLSARATKQILAAKPRTVNGRPTYPVTNLDGYTISLRTKHGLLRYRVRSAYGVAKADLPMMNPTWRAQTKRRVVIITCAQRAGRDYDYNVVVEAYLTSSRAS